MKITTIIKKRTGFKIIKMKSGFFLIMGVVALATLFSCNEKEEDSTTDSSVYDELYYAKHGSITSNDPAFNITEDGNTINFNAVGGDVVVNVLCEAEWDATVDASWLSVSVGTNSIIVSAELNTEETAKYGLVTLSTVESGFKIGTINVIEEAYSGPEIIVASTEWYAPATGSLSKEIAVSCTEVDWTVGDISEDWIMATNADSCVVVTVVENANEDVRIGEVILSCTDGVNVAAATIAVTQAGYGLPELNLESTEWNAPGVGILTTEIGVESTAEWKVESPAESWVSAEKSGNNAVAITVERNSAPESRSAYVVVSCSDGVNTIEKTIAVNQDGEVFITLSSDTFVSSGNGETAEITVTSNFGWDYIYDPTDDWFVVNRDGDALNVTITAGNSTGADFEGIVTVIAGDGAYNATEAQLIIKETSVDVSLMILEYNIPSDGTELTLPLYSSSTKCDVNWGDGSTESVSGKYPTHIYETAGIYTVTLDGTVPALSHQATAIRNSGSPALLIRVVQWGHTGLNDLNYAFYNCTNLVSLPEVTGISLQSVASLSDTFEGCSSLEAIPDDLFAMCTSTSISNIGYLFSNCSSIKFVPEGLFDALTSVTAVQYVFSGCSSLEEIPSSLFDNCKKVVNFSNTFRNCTSLVSEVPYTVLDNGAKVYLYDRADHTDVFSAPTTTTSCFSNCINMQGYDDIPASWK